MTATHLAVERPPDAGEALVRAPLYIGQVRCDPPVILAPMAAVTNPPFRILCRELGAGLVVTEMISARGLAEGSRRSLEMLDVRPSERPVCVQVFGADADDLARAAVVVERAGADMIDINMGCPMKKVVKSGHGAALLREPRKVFEVVQAMTRAVSIPVTAKIRAGWEESNAVDVARAIEDAGGAAVTIHARTRGAMFEGHPDLGEIAALKAAVSIPVIGNGDVRDVASAREMLALTGCDAVMVARGCMGYPWIFRELAASLRGEVIPSAPTLDERRGLLRHIDLYVETYGERITCLQIRKHLLWYFRDTPGERVIKERMEGLWLIAQVKGAVDEALGACMAPGLRFARGLDSHPNRRQLPRAQG